MAEVKTLDDLVLAAQLANVYLITLTTLEKGTFYHHFLMNNMPHGEVLKCHKKVQNLLVEYLENLPDEEEPKKDEHPA